MKHSNKFSTHHHHPPQHHRINHPTTTHHPPLHHHHHHTPLHFSDHDRQLADEVLFLHSLWHRGPPPPPPPSHTTHLLHATHTTHFKKTTKNNKTLIPPYLPSSDKEWPVVAASNGPGPSEWPEFKTQTQPLTRPATAREQARAAGVRIQLNAVESCRRLFDDGDDDDDEDDVDDGDDEEEVDFFENLFEEDEELRGFYARNCGGGDGGGDGGGGGGGGEFVCLVCGVIGNNVGRKYKNCVALVQHSRTVSKTKKKKAHRAYGCVVCKLLGWDVDRLPSFPTSVGVEDVVLKGEVNNQADKDPVVGELGRDARVAEASQTERESIPDAPEKDNLTSTNVVCASTELTHGEGEVKKLNDDTSSAVDMEADAANASHSQSMPESTPNAIDKGNVCMASAVTHAEVENHDSEKERVCSNSENAVSQRLDEPESNQDEAVKNVGEESSVLGSKPSESESSMAGDDPFEQLPCLPGAFQIPE